MTKKRNTRNRGNSNLNFQQLESRQLLAAPHDFAWMPDPAWFFTSDQVETRSYSDPVEIQWNGQNVLAEPNEWIVKFDVSDSEMTPLNMDSVFDARSLPINFVEGLGTEGLVLVKSERLSLQAEIELFTNMDDVEYFEPNIVEPSVVQTNDPYFDSLWGLHNDGSFESKNGPFDSKVDADIDAPQAWSITTGSHDVVVAVIDTGIEYTHPDLDQNIWTNPGEIPGNGIDDDQNGFVDDYHGYDFHNNDPDPTDDHGHGTHVAGTIGAEANNSIGVVGISHHVSMMPLKIISANSRGSIHSAAKAINYTTMMKTRYGVNVVLSNNSWGVGSKSVALEEAVEAHHQAGILLVAAAGNKSNNSDIIKSYPASFDHENIISVGATDANDHPAWFSNYGPQTVDIWAPGEEIYSTYLSGGYEWNSGTSMAAPHVAGAAALIFANDPSSTATDAKAAILNSAEPIDEMGKSTVTGGRLNAALALENHGGGTNPPQVTYQFVSERGRTTLVVNGTENSDQITLAPGISTSTLVANGVELVEFDNKEVNRIEIHGFGGDDSIEAKGISIPLTIYGGTGNDQISAGSSSDLIYCGAGNDVAKGRKGNDTIFGEEGHDILRGGQGNDHLKGGYDNDLLIGNQGIDRLLGQRGSDMLAGGAGIDDLNGGRGNNEIWQDKLPTSAKRRFLDEFLTSDPNTSEIVTTSIQNDVLQIRSETGITIPLEITVIVENGLIVARNFGEAIAVLPDWQPNSVEIVGGAGNDVLRNATSLPSVIIGGDGNDSLFGGVGNDIINAGHGDDLVFGDHGNDRLLGGPGMDQIDAGPDEDHVEGNAGNDLLIGNAGHDYILGGLGDDVIHGWQHNDTIFGGPGDDSINGGSGNDIVHGEDGDDQIEGDYGNDRLYGGPGMDQIDAGPDEDYVEGNAGNDVLIGKAGHDYIMGGLGDDLIQGWQHNDTIIGGPGNDLINGGSGDDNLYGDEGDDQIDGDHGNDLIFGHDGNDSIYGRAGNDYISAGPGMDYVDGGDQDDQIHGNAGPDELIGGPGHDFIMGGLGDDVIHAGDGNDHVDGELGNDRLYAWLGNDTMLGGDGDDLIYGDAGNNVLDGGAGNDTIRGGVHNDVIRGQDGNDNINGMRGHDLIYGGPGNDLLEGGEHNDTIEGNAGEDTIYGGNGLDQLFGGLGNDLLFGGDDDDVLYGNEGDDEMNGNRGADQLFGNQGNDTMRGGLGDDLLRGGQGNDTIYGQEGIDEIVGGSGLDWMDGGQEEDLIDGFWERWWRNHGFYGPIQR